MHFRVDVRRRYHYNASWQVLEVRKHGDADRYKQYAWDERYIDAPVLRWWDSNGDFEDTNEVLHYTNDANMNPDVTSRAVVDTDGDVVERYAYDPCGEVTFLHGADDADGAVTEWTEDTVATTWKYAYYWSPRYVDDLVRREENGGGRIWYATDANFNVTSACEQYTSDPPAVLERYLYGPYGQVTVLDPNWSLDADGVSDYDQQVLYAGYRWDPETGLYHVRHRTYHPTLGRWMQRDPAGYRDGMGQYEYVRSNPSSHTDPDGTLSMSIDNAGVKGRFYFPEPSRDSTARGIVFWDPFEGQGPVRLSVDGRDVETVSTESGGWLVDIGAHGELLGCAKEFKWDWDWLARPEDDKHKLTGFIRLSRDGEGSNEKTYTAERKHFRDTTAGINYTLAEGWGLSGLVLGVHGYYVEFTVKAPMSWVSRPQCVWDSDLSVQLEWHYNATKEGLLGLHQIDSQFGVSSGIGSLDDFERKVHRPPSMRRNRSPNSGPPPPSERGREIVRYPHPVADIWFTADRSYWLTAYFGTFAIQGDGSYTPSFRNDIAIELVP